ncbi:Helix-turn-helix domain protein [Actinomadura rubteroloni]|uniref:Helix-turn-helix domain protein n=1 Tax=Actinomadura rubteroloni TaxID=1926885 RepID=A0A2P4UF02_9ACTN|nr:helix-turn-helix domain-containing protein [Actinomadura rubteroloni]POM23633.1 Helix-turn-helix domain protein [Actinomadura rubteroloni]
MSDRHDPDSISGEPTDDATNELRVYTVLEVAELLGVSRDTVFALLRTGELRSIRIRERGRRVTHGQLRAYLKRREDAADSDSA